MITPSNVPLQVFHSAFNIQSFSISSISRPLSPAGPLDDPPIACGRRADDRDEGGRFSSSRSASVPTSRRGRTTQRRLQSPSATPGSAASGTMARRTPRPCNLSLTFMQNPGPGWSRCQLTGTLRPACKNTKRCRPGALLAVEGPNEPNNFRAPIRANGHRTRLPCRWRCSRGICTQPVKADPRLAGSPSFIQVKPAGPSRIIAGCSSLPFQRGPAP